MTAPSRNIGPRWPYLLVGIAVQALMSCAHPVPTPEAMHEAIVRITPSSGELVGMAVDSVTGEPLSHALVIANRIDGPTDSDRVAAGYFGVFRMRPLPPGLYQFKVLYIGYSPRTLDVRLPLASNTILLATLSPEHCEQYVDLIVCSPATDSQPTPLQRDTGQRCVTDRVVDTLAILATPTPGRYALTLVATMGPGTGNRSSGSLWLHPTSPIDSSPIPGRKLVHTNQSETPLFGAAELDWDRVDAPILPSDTLEPAPTSRDPVHPGVLVLIQNWEHPALRKQPILLIGTLSNRRDEEGWMDGAGIELVVRSEREENFSGTWGAWGIVEGGAGYFCASYLGPS